MKYYFYQLILVKLTQSVNYYFYYYYVNDSYYYYMNYSYYYYMNNFYGYLWIFIMNNITNSHY